jgi:omega-amidase
MTRTQGVVLAQIPVGFDVAANVAAIESALSAARPGDLVVTPEGSVSGYPSHGSEELAMVGRIDAGSVHRALDELGEAACRAGVHLFAGACLSEEAGLSNAAVVLAADGRRVTYRKVNLAPVERGLFLPGNDLAPVSLPASWGDVSVGVQVCRDIRFPEQWIALALAGAEIFVHPTNALEGTADRQVWRSMLVARAHELQRFVVSVNAAGEGQHSPTLAVDPGGRVVCELPPGVEDIRRIEIDLDLNASDYLNQRRTDLTGRASADPAERR